MQRDEDDLTKNEENLKVFKYFQNRDIKHDFRADCFHDNVSHNDEKSNSEKMRNNVSNRCMSDMKNVFISFFRFFSRILRRERRRYVLFRTTSKSHI